MAGEQHHTHAIVLSTLDHGESDKILHLLTADFGRISCIAKGAKRSKKRFVNKLEPFSFLEICFTDYPNRSLAFLNEAELHTPFLEIRSQIRLYTVASVILEFLLQGVKEREQDHEIFRLALWGLHNLCKHSSPHTVLALFLLRYFDRIGYRPALSCCHHCGIQHDEKIPFYFHFLQGGLICGNCIPEKNIPPLSRGTVQFLYKAQSQPLDTLHRIKVGGTVLAESLHLLHHYGRTLLQRDICSWKMLKIGQEERPTLKEHL